MKLRQPTDFLVLQALAEEGRNVAPNLAVRTGKSRANINTRLPVLEDYSLVTKVGPADRSGLYEITERGRYAVALRDRYGLVPDFGRLIEEAIASETELANISNWNDSSAAETHD